LAVDAVQAAAALEAVRSEEAVSRDVAAVHADPRASSVRDVRASTRD
jgi:hypothetical protein